MAFESKYDWIYITFIVILSGVTLFFSNFAMIAGFWYVSLILTILLCFVCYLFFWTSIRLEECFIEIRFGFFKKRIRYSAIKEVKITQNIISSFATSRKRIGIRTGDKKGVFNYTYISPVRLNDFLKELRAKLGCEVEFGENTSETKKSI